MKTLAQILAMPIIGNAYSDRPLFDAVHEFLMSDANSMEDKIKVLAKSDKAMGSKSPAADEQAVKDYIQFILDDIADEDPCPC